MADDDVECAIGNGVKMQDVDKLCGNCKHSHKYGILRYSPDNVALYNARPCSCGCDDFVEAIPGEENLPALSQPQIKDIWARTSFLGAQVPLATRIAVAQIMSLGKDEHPATAMIHQWPEFVGLMISQITDIRGAMTRDENKFAHLVAHTDEIVESMRGVVQLSERLATIVAQNERMAEHIAELQAEVAQLRGKDGLNDGSTVAPIPDRNEDKFNKTAQRAWEDRVFTEHSRPLRDEPIATDSHPSSDSDEPAE